MSADDRVPLLLLRLVEYTCETIASLLNGETTPWLLGTNDGARNVIYENQATKREEEGK